MVGKAGAALTGGKVQTGSLPSTMDYELQPEISFGVKYQLTKRLNLTSNLYYIHGTRGSSQLTHSDGYAVLHGSITADDINSFTNYTPITVTNIKPMALYGVMFGITYDF